MKKTCICFLILVLATSAAWAEGTVTHESRAGFTLTYDPALFWADEDTLVWSNAGNDTACLVVQRFEGRTADELIEGLIFNSYMEEFTQEDVLIGAETSDGYAVPCLSYVTGPLPGDMTFSFCLLTRERDVLVMEICCSLSLLDVASGDLERLIQTFCLTDAVGGVPAETGTAAKDQCSACGEWYTEGAVFCYHICIPAGQQPVAQPEKVQCAACGGWFEVGNEFRNHVCVPRQQEAYKEPEMVHCDVCGGWYEAGNVFRNHKCVPQGWEGHPEPEPKMVYCDVCGGWYEEGNVFRNHKCVPQGWEGHPEPEMVYCDVCGGWYEEGNVFRNHECIPEGWEGHPEPEAESESEPEVEYCDVCGGWYEEGNEFRNHECIPEGWEGHPEP